MTHTYPPRYAKWKRRKGKPTDERATPQEFFDRLDERFRFNLDVAASAENAKCERYFTQEDDGLAQPWCRAFRKIAAFREPIDPESIGMVVEMPGRVWCNPPYSDIPSWILKAHEEFEKGNAELIVMLLPADTSTDWFHDLLMAGPHRLHFSYLRGRLKFAGDQGAKFPSMLVIWEKPLEAK